MRGELDVPQTDADHATLNTLLEEIFGDSTAGMQVPSHEIDELLLLSSWFQRFPDELGRTAPYQRVG